MSSMIQNERQTIAPAVVPTCGTCGETTAPGAGCLNVGTCRDADRAATRGATGARAKFAPAAWSASGRTD